MNNKSSPSIIARETLRQLATLKIPPSPDNYHRLYNEIAGVSAVDEQLKPNDSSPEQSFAWGKTITSLMKQLETTHGTLTLAKKREGLNRVLTKFSSDPVQLHGKLLSLVDSWVSLSTTGKESVEIEGINNPSLIEKSVEDHATTMIAQAGVLQNDITDLLLGQLRELLVEILEHITNLQLGDVAFVDEAKSLAKKVRLINDKQELDQFVTSFKQLGINLNSYGGNSVLLQQRLLRLFNLLVDSTGELLAGDQWLQQHIAILRGTMSNQLDLSVIEQAEQHIVEITSKQNEIKSSLGEAKTTLKRMITCLVDNIEDLSAATGDYHDRIASYSEKVSRADEIPDLNQLLVEILHETKQMQENVLNSRDELLAARAEVEIAENKINALESKLLEMGEKVHEDHLTGILNRRGLDNAFERESARALRDHKPMCLALLDIDNFKQLNDVHGHHVGDNALVYLVEAVKETTRPHDIVARFGGEEFVILLPDAEIDEAVAVISRVRRNLTKRFFLHENKRLLITFSAGVAEYQTNESQDNIIVRADKALYQAKNNGKNQVVAAESL